MAAAFDQYESTYEAEVGRAISFAGQEHSFFIEAKVRALLEIAERRLGETSQLDGLDVGCGPGDAHRMLAPRLATLRGVDVSRPILEAAAKRNPSVAYDHYEGERLPYEDRSFDVVVATCVLHHVPPPGWTMFTRELSRVVRKGGLVAVMEHNPFNPLTRLVVSRCAFDDDAVLLRRSATARLLGQAGIAVTDSRYLLFFPWRGGLIRRLETRLSSLPLGAQYVVAGTPA